MNANSNNRIQYLDLMRAFAVVMMLQGHTIHVLLADEYRTFDSLIYTIWHSLRGFTAPVFMFTAGVVFAYLFNNKNLTFKKNPRVKKGIKRAVTLLVIGYLLRYPTYKVFDFSDVTIAQWTIFFAVDALHLIAVGLLLIILLEWFSQKLSIKNLNVYLIINLTIFLLSPLVNNIDWTNWLPVPLASYLYFDMGSIFPLFPYAGYIFAGAALGAFLAMNPQKYNEVKFNMYLGIAGLILAAASKIIALYFSSPLDWNENIFLSFYRIGVVLIFNSLIALVSIKIRTIPKFILTFGRLSLIIYVVHLVIVYGSAWSIGMYQLIGRSVNLELTIITALLMIFLMIILSLFIDGFDKRKIFNKIKSPIKEKIAEEKK